MEKKLLNQIIPILPKEISTFVDLFCGGCSVGINVLSKKYIFNDNLIYLIDMYKIFQSTQVQEIINYIENRISEYNLSLINTDGYIELRKEYNLKRNPLDLFVLVSFSFNHQIRFNSIHYYNTPFGKNRSKYNPKMKENLIQFLNVLQSKEISFMSNDFRRFDFTKINSNDFVYADPPYLITTGTYNDGKRGGSGWSNTEEIALLNILKGLNDRNVRFALSNVLTHKGKTNNMLKEWILKNKFNMHLMKINYNNSNYQTLKYDNKETQEVLITNF